MRLDRPQEDLLRAYIETPSVTHRPNGDLVDLLDARFRKAGWDTEILDSPRYPGLKNFVARLGPASAGGLVINSHLDTVEPVAGDWDGGTPFKLAYRDGYYTGNGAVDTKGPTVAAILAATDGINSTDLKKGIAFWLNHSEENAVDGVPLKGSREMVDWARKTGVRPDAMVVVEPTGLAPGHAHNGYAKVSVETRGKAAHSSVPESGDNAIERMGEVIAALRDLRLHLRKAHDIPLNIGFVSGGREDQVNVVAEACRLLLDYRCPPGGLSAEAVLQEIAQALGPTVAAPRFEIEPIPPFHSDPDRPIVRLAARITGKTPQKIGFYSDGAVYKALQDDGCLKDGMLILGCGDVRYAHAANERIAAAEIAEGIAVFRNLIAGYCCEEGP